MLWWVWFPLDPPILQQLVYPQIGRILNKTSCQQWKKSEFPWFVKIANWSFSMELSKRDGGLSEPTCYSQNPKERSGKGQGKLSHQPAVTVRCGAWPGYHMDGHGPQAHRKWHGNRLFTRVHIELVSLACRIILDSFGIYSATVHFQSLRTKLDSISK